ncbi:MAG: Gfo/Idh/MocA family oxidoreductase [Isosphaeraceae bacterium]
MKAIPRRDFLKGSMAAGLGLGFPGLLTAASRPNEDVRIAVIGLGSTTAVGGVGGRGHQLIGKLREVKGARIVALADVDPAHIDREVKAARDHEGQLPTHNDFRKILDDKNIDAVVVALPNHWHALATVWACQAGKDVYVEKPFSHDLWEGHQMVAAARKYGRMVQAGTQRRSSTLLPKAFESLKGEIGATRFAHALVYRARDGIGQVDAPTPTGAVDYDLWCGPIAKKPLKRKQLHYEWHWFWDTGNGEMGNNGIHVIDIARMALGHQGPPPRAMSIGGRFGFDDCGETANTQVAILDFQPAPLICEVRNLKKGADSMGNYRGQAGGILIDCEGGYFAGDFGGGAIYDRQGKKVRDVKEGENSKTAEREHLANFLDAVRSRKAADLAAEALIAHHSTACCHMANVSHQIGKQARPEAIRDAVSGNAELADAFDRCREHLRKNGVNLDETRATLGPWVTFDAEKCRFVGDFAEAANALVRREYREPFVVPDIARA